MTKTQPFKMVIKLTDSIGELYPYSLGHELAIAKMLCEEVWTNRIENNFSTDCIELIGPDGSVWDSYDGTWYDQSYQKEADVELQSFPLEAYEWT